MRWLPWHRKKERTQTSERAGAVAVAERPARDMAPPRVHVEPRGAALSFARDALALSGAQVQAEDPDLLAVTLPDGARVHYTGSLARARGEADATLLVQGGAALGTLLDEVALRGGRVAFALPASGHPLALAAVALTEPPADCGRCALGADAEHASLCATCPLRAGRLTLRGVGRVGGARELQRYESVAVELTYRVVYRDRDGRHDESHRLAYSLETGEPVAPVTLDALAACMPCSMPTDLDMAPITARARADLERALDAGAALLALRADAEYQRRLHDLHLTHERLLRETPETRAELDASYAAERARLADLFTVGVEAELVGVAYISTILAEVALRHAGGELTLTVDLGRAAVLPPRCEVCAAPTRAGRLCAQGHIVCAACCGVDPECPLCGDTSAIRGASPRSRRDPRRVPTQASDTLPAEWLADLSEPLWQSFVAWYLAAEGHAAGPPETQHGLPLWRLRLGVGNGAEDAARSGYAVAVRPMPGRRLGAADVRVAIDACKGESGPMEMLVTPTVADEDALRETEKSGVRLVAREALAVFLEAMGTAHASALAAAERDAEARAQAAIETQRALLDALTAIEKEIAACANSRRAAGRGPLTAATNTISAAMHEAERALLAWDTLITDWLANFGERPAPDGSLRILCSPNELRTLAERAEHLRAALMRPVGALSGTPGSGESGYTAWRKALLERLTADCEALCWRISVVNLERWRDATAARDANAAAHAESTAQAAKHTAMRATKARDLLAARIGL